MKIMATKSVMHIMAGNDVVEDAEGYVNNNGGENGLIYKRNQNTIEARQNCLDHASLPLEVTCCQSHVFDSLLKPLMSLISFS